MRLKRVIRTAMFLSLPFVFGAAVGAAGCFLYVFDRIVFEQLYTEEVTRCIDTLWYVRQGESKDIRSKEMMILSLEERLNGFLDVLRRTFVIGSSEPGIPPEKLSQRRLEAFQASKQYYEQHDDRPRERRGLGYQSLRAYLETVPWPKERLERDRWNAVYKGPVPQPAPELTVEWIGKPRTMAEFRGRVVLLDFWGMRCGGCMNSMPELQRLQETYEGLGLSVVAVHCQRDQDQQAREYVKEHGCTFSVCLPTSPDLFSKYLVQGLPAYYLIDREGRLVWGPKRKLPSDKRIMALLAVEQKNGANDGDSDAAQPATRTVSSAHIGARRACGCKLWHDNRSITLTAVASPLIAPADDAKGGCF